jgi:hypothetical protein
VLIEASRARLEVDPAVNDALTALGACTDLVSYCYAPPERTLDGCVRSVRVCATRRPWEESEPCCAEACRKQYDALRKGGRDALGAFDEAFFAGQTCRPGVGDLLRSKS